MKKRPIGYVKPVKDFRSMQRGKIVATSSACCSDLVPHSFCKRKFELSYGQKYVKQRISQKFPDLTKPHAPEQIPRVLVDHEVGSGKSELALQIVNDHLKKGLNAIVACPDSDNINTWQREIFKERDDDEPIYKMWNFHPKNIDDSDFSSSRTLKGIYKSQWEKFRSSRKNSKMGTFYLDTHDFVFRSLAALNDHSEKWPNAKVSFFAQSVTHITEKSKTRLKTLKDQIKFHTKNFLIVIDECHQCIDSTKTKDNKYKYVNSLALLGMLMFAHDSCKIVLMTATALHVTGVGGVGALVYTLYPRPRKSLMRNPAWKKADGTDGFPNKKIDNKDEKILLTKVNENEEDQDNENYDENDEENNGQIDNVGGISNENFKRRFLNKEKTRESPPVATRIIRSESVPSKFSLSAFSGLISESVNKVKANNASFLDSVGKNGKMKGDKNIVYAKIFAELTVDCIDFFNSIYNKSGKFIVTDPVHGVSGFISHWSTSKDVSLYPRASLSTCSISSRKFHFDKPCVYPLEVPFAPIHNIMLLPRKKALTNIKKVHDVITKEDPFTEQGVLNQEQRLLGLLQGRQQTMISNLCASDMSASSSSNTSSSNTSKFKCFTKSNKTFSQKAKANIVHTIVTDVFKHLKRVELIKQKGRNNAKEEWVKKGTASFAVIPSSLQSHGDKIMKMPPIKPVVYKLTKLQTPEQVKKLAKTKKESIATKKKELVQIEKNISETAEKLATDASKAASKAPSKKSITTTGRKKAKPLKFRSLSRARLTKKTKKELEKDYHKQVHARNRTQKEIEKLESTPNITFEINEHQSSKSFDIEGQIEFYKDNLVKAKGTDEQKHALEQLYSEKLINTGIKFLNHLDDVFTQSSDGVKLIDAKIREESRKKFVKIRNDLLKMETGITALSMAGLTATVSVNGKKTPELVGQPLSIYGKDETNPVFFPRPGNVLPMFSLFSTANLMLANIIRSTSNRVNSSTSPDAKRKGSVRVTLPEDNSKGNVMVYVDAYARSEGNELCHSLINQASCIQIASGFHEDTSSIFAVTGVCKIIDKKLTSPSSLSREINHKKVDGPIFEFKTGKLFDAKSGSTTPDIRMWLHTMDTYIKNVDEMIQKTFEKPKGVDKHLEFLLTKNVEFESIGISAYGYGTRKQKSYNYYHDKDTIAYHNPVLSLLYSIFQHLSSEEAIAHIENELSLSVGKLNWQQIANGKDTYEMVIQNKIQSTRNRISLFKQDLFQKIRAIRGYLDNKLKTPVFFRYFVSKQKSVTSGKMKFIHLLNKPSKAILEKIYNTPENNTGDLCNAVISEMTHGGSMFNTPYLILYHKQQKRQPITNAQRKQIYGRNARNCSMYLNPQNMIKRIDLKTTNSSFFGDENVFVEGSNSPSPVRLPSATENSPSLSKGEEESANNSSSANLNNNNINKSKNKSKNKSNSKRNSKSKSKNNNSKTNLATHSQVPTTRTRTALTNDNDIDRSPAKTIPKGMQTFGIKIGKASDTMPLKHFSTYMGYDSDLFKCGKDCDLTQQLYTFARKVCNANTTGVLLGQSKAMADSVRQLLLCDRDRRLDLYDSDSEVNKLKSHRGMKTSEQNLIFENMRKKAANAEMFKNYIRGESFVPTENNTIKERGENTPQNNTKWTKLIKYKFATQLMRTGLYDHWLKNIQKDSLSVVDDFTKKAMDAKVSPSRIKYDLTREEEFLSFKKSPRKKTLAMNYGTFVAQNGNVPDVKKLSLWKKSASKQQVFNLLFTKQKNTSLSNAGWVIEEINNVRTGIIKKKGTNEALKYSASGDPVKALAKYLLKKNTLNEGEQKLIHSRGEKFFIHAKPVPQAYLRQIPILVKENITGEKLLAGVKLVNIIKKRMLKKRMPIGPVKKVSVKTTKEPVKAAKESVGFGTKPTKPQKKQNTINEKMKLELSKSKFKIMLKKSGKFKIMYSKGFSPEKRVNEDQRVQKCFKNIYDDLPKDVSTLVEIKIDNGQIKCKANLKQSIKEIKIANNN